jgi:hypothetical protein
MKRTLTSMHGIGTSSARHVQGWRSVGGATGAATELGTQPIYFGWQIIDAYNLNGTDGLLWLAYFPETTNGKIPPHPPFVARSASCFVSFRP